MYIFCLYTSVRMQCVHQAVHTLCVHQTVYTRSIHSHVLKAIHPWSTYITQIKFNNVGGSQVLEHANKGCQSLLQNPPILHHGQGKKHHSRWQHLCASACQQVALVTTSTDQFLTSRLQEVRRVPFNRFTYKVFLSGYCIQ